MFQSTHYRAERGSPPNRHTKLISPATGIRWGQGGHHIPHQRKALTMATAWNLSSSEEADSASASAPGSSGPDWSFIFRPDSASCNLSTDHYPKINPGIEGEVHIPHGAKRSLCQPAEARQRLAVCPFTQRRQHSPSTTPTTRRLSIPGCSVLSSPSQHTRPPRTDLGVMCLESGNCP